MPRYYIALIIVGIAYYSVDLLLIYQVLDIKVTYKEVSTLIRSIFLHVSGSLILWFLYESSERLFIECENVAPLRMRHPPPQDSAGNFCYSARSLN